MKINQLIKAHKPQFTMTLSFGINNNPEHNYILTCQQPLTIYDTI